ncbi:MAG: tetratricopeptide repeat protein [Phycisphaerales bacterium]|nr:MAG: tetratricopeptide repeat protein [Phycisphaerales bacterium]
MTGIRRPLPPQRGKAGSSPRTQRVLRPLPAILVLGVTLAIYLGCAGHELLGWDDIDYVIENPVLRLPFGEFLSRITTGFVPRAHGDFLPVTMLSYWLEFRAEGLRPRLYHLDNVLLFAVSCAALWHVIARVTGQRKVALWVALLYAAHPLNVEAVAWVSERKSVLSLLLCLFALTLALPSGKHEDQARTHPWPRWIAALAVYLLACLAKSAVVFFPILVWGYYWIIARRSFVASAARGLLFVVPAGLAAWARLAGHAASGQTGFAPFETAAAKGMTILSLLGGYVGKILLPLNLNHCYPLQVTETPGDPFLWIGLAVLVLAVAGIILLRRRLPVAAFGLLWFLAGWLPHMQLRPIPPALRADRYMFYALPGVILFVVVLLGYLLADERRARLRLPAALVGAVVVMVFAVATMRRQAVWADDFTLWEDSLAKTPDSVIANSHYGVLLLEAGRIEDAERHFQRALETSPQDFMSLNGLGAVRSRRGLHAEALGLLTQALAVPNVPPEKQAQTYAAMGGSELARRNIRGALDAYGRAVELNPYLPDAHGGYGSALAVAGRLEEALAEHRKAIQMAPDDPTLLFNYSLALTSADRTDEALDALRRCLELKPDYGRAYGQMGVIYAGRKQWQEAVRYFEQAARLAPGDRQIAEMLSRARAEMQSSGMPTNRAQGQE